ncbi:sodium:solute symporter family protein [Pseudonocardia acaciae]|uniref:sodium:solute symporter family protein n=1 Tax=Pseudonocardia acaciae TaxID=551276 RepID=UPI0006868EFB|nr:sodium:solute symporter family protein [Pseudonocardia acaciae]
MIYAVAAVVALGAIGGGIWLAARGRRVDVREWSVGGRRFGGFLFWFLLAGETFTTFSILGASQAVYADGAPAYYILGTVVLTSAFGYWAVPRIWRAGKDHGLMTEGDYFSRRFAAPWLGAALGLFGILALLMYAQVQLTGLSLMLKTLFGPQTPDSLSIVAAGLLVAVFIGVGGMRSAAFGAVVKDILIVVVLLILALIAAGAAGVSGWGGIFDAVAERHPDAATLPGLTGGAHNQWWWMSFLLLAPIGAFVFPHSFQVSFTAKDVRTIRRNQIVQPLYSLFYLLVVVVALAALLTNPGLRGAAANGALLLFARTHAPDWLIGLLAGSGILVALIPTAVLVLCCSSLFTRNVYPVVRGEASEAEQLRISRIAAVVLTAAAVLITMARTQALLDIMVGVYNAIGQLAPALFGSLLWRRISAAGAISGTVVGGLAVAIPPFGNAMLALCPAGTVVGLPALVLNILVTVVVSLVTKPPPSDAVTVGIPAVDRSVTSPHNP